MTVQTDSPTNHWIDRLIGWQGAAPSTRARLLEAFCSGIRSRSIVSNSIAALIVAVFIIADTRNPVHVAWLLCALLGGLLPRGYAARLRRENRFSAQPEHKALMFIALSAVYGGIWGVGPFLLLPAISGSSVGILLIIIIFGTVMGPYAAMPGILYARLLTTGVPTVVAISLYTSTELTVVSIVLGAWLVLRTDVWRGYHRNLRRQMELREALETQQRQLQEANRAKQQANEELEVMAQTDPLTGAANRRQFMEQLGRLQAPASLLLFDVDRFKSINDNYGHHAGDAVLTDLADVAHEMLRKEDLLARLGGDEFAVILPGVSAAGAHRIAERIRKTIHERRVRLDTYSIYASVSIGISSVAADQDCDLAELLRQADEALYAAKREGRNRTAVSESVLQQQSLGT